MTDIEMVPLFAGYDTAPEGVQNSHTLSDDQRGTITAWQERRFTGAVWGDTDVIVNAVIEAGVSCTWDGRLRAYLVPIHVLDRVLVEVEKAGHRVDYRSGLW